MVCKMNLYLIIFIFSLRITIIFCTPKCEDFVTCGTCILNTFEDCVWCPDETHIEKRCQPKELADKSWCNKIISKPEIKLEITKNDDWSSGESGKKIVQFKPQFANVTLATPGASVDIPMQYKPAKDAPLDIYFVIDNSLNIAKFKTSLIDHTESIFEGVKNYTNNIRLGIGTYIEKPVLPYANPDEDDIVYTFRNELPLTNNSLTFINTLKSIKPGSNNDSPEDLLDALMQAMLCQEQINWTKDSRRIIVVFTNAFYHTAGDGKILGAFKRHNMKCYENSHMDNILMDYPSIGQVNKIAKDNGYVIIFAHVDDENNNYPIQEYYELLSQSINGAKSERLNHENIAQIIKDEYIGIVEDVNIGYESSSEDIQVTITKTCTDCKAMHSKPLDFVATIKVISCNRLKDKEIIKITPTSLNEFLQIEIEFQCQCDCEKDNSVGVRSEKCNGKGDYQCGICKCDSDRFGDDCKCKIDSKNITEYIKDCRKDDNDAFRCSGHGECSCGKCVKCHNGFSGPFCEYDENACPRPGGKVCSGHGRCYMGLCECDRHWRHSLNGIDDCGCSLDTRSCTAPHSKEVCSGNGDCSCGTCICNSTTNSNDTCSGRYCDKCSWFTAKRCEELQDYAYCRFKNQTGCQDTYDLTDTIVVFVNRSEINSPKNSEWYMANLCRVKIGDDESIFVFKYYYTSDIAGIRANDTMLTLVIQNELDEKPPADIWVPVGSAIGGILIIGLFSLILWKLLIDYYDEREYNQFVEKAKAAGYNVTMTENPWYEPPTTTFMNPAHDSSRCADKQGSEF